MKALQLGSYLKTKWFLDAAKRLDIKITQDKNEKFDFVLPQPFESSNVLNNLDLDPIRKKLYTICLDKGKFYDFCDYNNLPYPKKTKKFPAIIKPLVGEGSQNVFIAEVKPNLSNYIQQQFIDGDLVGLNVAVINKEIIIYNFWKVISRFENSPYCINIQQTSSKDELPKELILGLKKLIEKLNIDNTVIQVEFIIKNNQYYFVEVNPRPGSVGIESLNSILIFSQPEEIIKLYAGLECNFYPYSTQKSSLCVRCCDISDGIVEKINWDNRYKNNIVYKNMHIKPGDLIKKTEIKDADQLYKSLGFVHAIGSSELESIENAKLYINNL